MKKLIILLLSFSTLISSADTCSLFLAEMKITPSSMEPTDILSAYLSRLLEEGVITNESLSLLLNDLEQNKELNNPIPHRFEGGEVIFIHSKDKVHYENLRTYLNFSDLDRNKLKFWVKEQVNKNQKEQQQRVSVIDETRNPLIKKVVMQFYRIEAGSGLMYLNTRHITLTNDFEMMHTPVTQFMWARIMGENPSHFKDGQYSKIISIQGKDIQMQPNNPVETITWWSAAEFANRLSVLEGLPPAYDFSKTKFKKGTRAEDGTLAAINNIYNINSPTGSIYDATGFRLPTDAEQEFVRSGRAQGLEKFLDGLSIQDKLRYMWGRENSANQTHPVTLNEPLIVGDADFYELICHVYEWSHDLAGDGPPNTLINPIAEDTNKAMRRVRGSNYSSTVQLVSPQSESLYNASEGIHTIGFRLVRTLK